MRCGKHNTPMLRDTYRVGVHYYCPKCAVDDVHSPQAGSEAVSAEFALLDAELGRYKRAFEYLDTSQGYSINPYRGGWSLLCRSRQTSGKTLLEAIEEATGI